MDEFFNKKVVTKYVKKYQAVHLDLKHSSLSKYKEKDMKYYVIGDVHGEYEILIRLVNRLPEDAELFFVGDLIDRGADSKKVVDFVRNGNHKCVLGNHEDMMIKEGERMKKIRESYTVDSLWAHNGGLATLLSYGIIEVSDCGDLEYTRDTDSIDKFIEDAEWMDTLPLAIKVPIKQSGYDILVSHACISGDWHSVLSAKKGCEEYAALKEYATWNRKQHGTQPTMGMLNIFGHTPQKYVGNPPGQFATEIGWINIDTGCVYDRDGLGKLTAVNMETLDTVVEER